jgi:hypothetical protein
LITESNEKEPTVLSFLMAEAETETAETTEVAAPEEVESPETSTSDQSEETTETEETADGQTEGEDEASTEEATEETESEVEPELPKKQAKTYSKELVDHYAERFGWTPEDIAKDKGKGYAVKKAIDSDIFIAEQNERLAALESQETAEEEPVQATESVEQSKPTPEQRAAYQENLAKFAKEITDPEQATAYAKDWCAAQGVDYEKAVKNGFKPDEFVHKQTMYAANLVNTILPRLLPAFLKAAVEANFPGFDKMYEGALNANTWEDLRASDASFKSLHAFGTPEFQAAYKEVTKANPWIEQMQLVDPKTGRQLSVPQVVATRYRVVAQMLSGQKVTPQTMQDAVNKGKQDATRNTRRVSAGRSLGAGRPTGKIAPAADKPEGGSLGDAYKREHGNSHAKSLEDLI